MIVNNREELNWEIAKRMILKKLSPEISATASQLEREYLEAGNVYGSYWHTLDKKIDEAIGQ